MIGAYYILMRNASRYFYNTLLPTRWKRPLSGIDPSPPCSSAVDVTGKVKVPCSHHPAPATTLTLDFHILMHLQTHCKANRSHTLPFLI